MIFLWLCLCLYGNAALATDEITSVRCLADEVCVGEKCEGTFQNSIAINIETSNCFPARPSDTVVALGQTIADESQIAQELDKQKGTLENERIHTTNLMFKIPIWIRTKEDLLESVEAKQPGLDLKMYPMNYTEPPLSSRLHQNTYDSERCDLTEVCVPEVCTFLDINFFGEPLLTTTAMTSDTVLETIANKYICKTAHDVGCVMPRHLNNNKSYNLNIIEATTYCGPLFGTSILTKLKKIPSYEAAYEKRFPTQRSVSVVYNHKLHSGVLVPLQIGRFIPDHYYNMGAVGRFGDGMLKTQAPPCNTRFLPRYMFANICVAPHEFDAISPNCIGTKDKPRSLLASVDSYDTTNFEKYTEKNINEKKSEFTNVLYTLNDPLIMIGPWSGYAAYDDDIYSSPRKYHNYGTFRPFVTYSKGTTDFTDLQVLQTVRQFYLYIPGKGDKHCTFGNQDWDATTIAGGLNEHCRQSNMAARLGMACAMWMSSDVFLDFQMITSHYNYKHKCREDRLTKLDNEFQWFIKHTEEYLYRRRRARTEGEYYDTKESLANSLVINQFWSITSMGVNGFLNDPAAFGHPKTGGVFRFPYKISENVDPHVQNATFQDCISTAVPGGTKKPCSLDSNDADGGQQPDKCHYRSCLQQLDYTGTTNAWKRKDHHGHEQPVEQALKSPLQTVDPNDFQTPVQRIPSHLLGSRFSTFISAMFSSSMMADQKGAEFSYYHPMFRPLVKLNQNYSTMPLPQQAYDESCTYVHQNNTNSSINASVSNYQGMKGYCYCKKHGDSPAFAASIVSLVRAFHLWVKLYDQSCNPKTFGRDTLDCNGTTPTFCSGTTDECLVPYQVKQFACGFHRPLMVYEILYNRGVLIDSLTGEFIHPYMISDAACDLQVCDVVQRGGRTTGHYMCAAQHSSELRDIVSTRGGHQHDAQYANHGWQNRKDWANYAATWYRTGTVHSRDWSIGSDPRYCYSSKGRCLVYNNWMLMQSPSDASSDNVNYYNAVEYNVDDSVVFHPSRADAGFLNDKTTKEAITCDCDKQPIVLKCSAEVPDSIYSYYISHRSASGKDKAYAELDLSGCAYSFEYNAHGPPIGLYLPSTRNNVVIYERNLASFERTASAADRYNEMHDILLGPGAPTASVGSDKLIFQESHLLKNPRNTDVYRTTFKYSCMRYPYGRVHRAHMSPNARTLLYGPEDEVDTRIEHQSLVGYCEFVNAAPGESQLRHCPNARQSPEERMAFCTSSHTQFMARHILYGYHVTSITLKSSCSDTHKVCLVIPGSPDTAGDIKSYTSGDVAGLNYTLLVAPFNASLLSRYMLEPRAMPMLPQQDNPFVMPDYHDPRLLENVSDTFMLETFGYKPTEIKGMLTLAANVEEYLVERGCTNITCAESLIVNEVTTFVDLLGEYKNALDMPECDEAEAVVPELGNIALKECVSYNEILLPLKEILIPVRHDGMRILSAYRSTTSPNTVYPIKFAGVPERASSCERFIVAGSRFELHASFDQSECVSDYHFDNFHLIPVKLVGVKLDETKVYIDSSATKLPMTVAVLGSDAELFNVPTILKIHNFQASIVSHNESDFDLAFARVSRVGEEAEVKVQCLDREDNTTVVNAPCRILIMGIRDDELLIYHYALPNGSEWAPALEQLAGSGQCVYGPPAALLKPSICLITDVSQYTGVFSYGYEQVAFRKSNNHHVPTMNVISVIMAILLIGLIFINIALWYHDDSFVRHTAGLQPHRVSYTDLEHVDGLTCKGNKIHFADQTYTIPTLEKAVRETPTAFPATLVKAFT